LRDIPPGQIVGQGPRRSRAHRHGPAFELTPPSPALRWAARLEAGGLRQNQVVDPPGRVTVGRREARGPAAISTSPDDRAHPGTGGESTATIPAPRANGTARAETPAACSCRTTPARVVADSKRPGGARGQALREPRAVPERRRGSTIGVGPHPRTGVTSGKLVILLGTTRPGLPRRWTLPRGAEVENYAPAADP